ncbi:MAG: phosphoribosylglycinamide formyltransferase [Pseudomonadota bacterium]
MPTEPPASTAPLGTPARTPLGVLISGRGSNLAALLNAARCPDFAADIVGVISNKADAGGLTIAADAGVPTAVVDHQAYPSRAAFETALSAQLEAFGASHVANAGWMRILTPVFVDRWRDRHFNIHPSLLPAFKGLDTHERVLAQGCTLSGCTVHYVREAMDDGPIIGQACVPVQSGDTPGILAQRVLAAEHALYPRAVQHALGGTFSASLQETTDAHLTAEMSGPLMISLNGDQTVGRVT